ncbi:hypothetical protein GCM10027168_60400 [Streptomyces capparidis]
MDYRRLFSEIRKRPSAYGLDGTYKEYVAFVTGCDAGNEWGLLAGFPEWLAMKAGREANATWSSLVLAAVGLPPAPPPAGHKDEAKAVEALFDLLDEFLAERVSARHVSLIISRYARR